MYFPIEDMPGPDRYKLMASCIGPRPIAWVVTRAANGALNAAPFSFFNMMAAEPPLVVLGLMRRPDGGHKDTAANILETREFTINLVSEDDAEAMNFTCIDAPADFDEVAAANIETAPSTTILPPRIASAPASFECRLYESMEPAGGSAVIVVGTVAGMHIDARFIDTERLHVDMPAMKLIGRMHGAGWYARTSDRFQMQRPSWERDRPESARPEPRRRD